MHTKTIVFGYTRDVQIIESASNESSRSLVKNVQEFNPFFLNTACVDMQYVGSKYSIAPFQVYHSVDKLAEVPVFAFARIRRNVTTHIKKASHTYYNHRSREIPRYPAS